MVEHHQIRLTQARGGKLALADSRRKGASRGLGALGR